MTRLEAILARLKVYLDATDRESDYTEDVAWLVRAVDELRDTLIASKIEHLIVEGDCWFSCPKSGESCRDDQVKTECDCGADAHNARIDATLTRLEESDA